jgi:hypothetical protein
MLLYACFIQGLLCCEVILLQTCFNPVLLSCEVIYFRRFTQGLLYNEVIYSRLVLLNTYLTKRVILFQYWFFSRPTLLWGILRQPCFSSRTTLL